jgi:hypothetical protein
MRNGAIKAKAHELATLAQIHGHKKATLNAFLPPQLRELPPPLTSEELAREYDARTRRMGIRKTENF